MQCQPLGLLLPADPDRLEGADWSARWGRILRLWLGSEEMSCDRLAMSALDLGGGKTVPMLCIGSPDPDTGEAVDVRQGDQSKTGGREKFQVPHENAQRQRPEVQGAGAGALRDPWMLFNHHPAFLSVL